MSEAVDLLINARWIVPVEPRDAVLADHAVAIRGGRIVDLLGQDEARTRYVADEVVEVLVGPEELAEGLAGGTEGVELSG